jgi:CRISPR system Cascade subunit CasB
MSTNEHQQQLPDFVKVKAYFDNRLTPGQRAELRRVSDPEDIDLIPVYYYLIRGFLQTGQRPDRRWRRVVYALPYAEHAEGAGGLGIHLARAGVREGRLFQMTRSEYPNDLVHLRRMLQQIKPTLDWHQFGGTLYFWGQEAKRRILEDYCLAM